MPVMVNHKEILDEEIYQEMQYHPASSAEQAMQEAARALVIRELLLQKAAELNIVADKSEDISAEEMIIETLLKRVIQLPDVDDDTLFRFYENNAHRFGKVDGAIPPFKDVQQAISDYLVETSWTNAVRAFVQSLVQEAKLSGVTFEQK